MPDSPAAARRVALDLADRAADWVTLQMPDLLAEPSAQARLYRLPYALARADRNDAAAKAMEQLGQQALASDGDLLPGPLRDRFSTRWASYPLTILASGAAALGDAALSRRILTSVTRTLVDPATGGLLGERPEVRQTRRQDLFPTAQYGITALELGDDDAVASTRHWIIDWWQRQPDVATAIYLSTEGPEHIVEDAPDRHGEAGSVLDFGEPGQPLASLGIAAAFLADAASTRSDDALLAAVEIQAQYSRAPAWALDLSISVQLCKRVWGAARLLSATGDTDYEESVLSMIEWFRAGVSEDGYWRAPGHLAPTAIGLDRLAVDAEITVEFIQHLVTAAQALEKR